MLFTQRWMLVEITGAKKMDITKDSQTFIERSSFERIKYVFGT